MNEITKNNVLKKLQENVEQILYIFQKHNIKKTNTSFNKYIKDVANIKFNINSGDIRKISIFIFTKNEKNRVANFLINLKDESHPYGLYTKDSNIEEENKYFIRKKQPYCLQNSHFITKQNKKLISLKTKNNSLGKKIDWLNEIDIILKPLYKILFRNEEDLNKHYTLINKNNRIKAFYENKNNEIKNIEDLKFFDCIKKEEENKIIFDNNLEMM